MLSVEAIPVQDKRFPEIMSNFARRKLWKDFTTVLNSNGVQGAWAVR